MTSIWCLGFLLFLLRHCVYSEVPEPMFRAQGSNIELGYCFGVDYIVVYRFAPEGDQLLGNSSANTPIAPPPDVQGRIHFNQQQSLLGLQIRNLTHTDSGTYRKECWMNQTLVSQLTQKLFVCNEEVESEEIIMTKDTITTELVCNSPSTGLEGTSVHWYHEMYPDYKITLFLDSSVSLEPLVEGVEFVVGVKDKGAVLVLDNKLLKSNYQFYCLVIKGDKCLSFQSMYGLDYSESRDIFASHGDKVVLNCSFDGHGQLWETPLGRMNGASETQNQMYISSEDKDFSLVISSVSDEHGGEYSCISSSLEMQYSLVLCPNMAALQSKKLVFEGGDVVLKCDTDQDGQKVQWYRGRSTKYELIYESSNDTVPIPEDLRGRLSRPDTGYSLRISNLEMKDEGIYFCVVSVAPNFLENEDYFKDDYDEENTLDEEFDDDANWSDSQRCIHKQDTVLIINKPRAGTSKTTPTADPTPTSNVPAYAVWIGLVGLAVLVGVIVAVVIALKKKDSSKQRKAASHSEDIL